MDHQQKPYKNLDVPNLVMAIGSTQFVKLNTQDLPIVLSVECREVNAI